MPLVVVIKPYKFAHLGIRVEEFSPGDEPIETTDECAEQGKADGAFEDASAPPAPPAPPPPAPAEEPPAPDEPPAEAPAAPAPPASGKKAK